MVCGYDVKKKKIFYKNPSYDEGKNNLYCSLLCVHENCFCTRAVSSHAFALASTIFAFDVMKKKFQ